MIKTQRIAAAAVGKVLAGASLTAVLHDVWRAHADLSDQQRGAIQDLSYGVLRFYGQLNTLLELLLKKPLWDENLRCLLLVGLYQLIYSKTAPHAIVDSAVSAARDLNNNKVVRGLVNAILRRFIRERTTLLERAAQTEIGRYSHPQWWINRLHAQYPQHYQAILEVSNLRPPMTLRVNRRKIDIAEYLELLNKNGVNARRLANDALELAQPAAVEKLPGFAEGLVSVQDMGAQLAAPMLDVRDSMRVLDACAAPGGKTAHLLELANVEVTALDVDAARVAMITQNLSRLGLSANHVMHGDVSQPSKWWNGEYFDRILADVPCSASGVVRRHPDIKWLRRESDLFQFAGKQREILDSLWRMLSRDGKLLYTTCSIFAEENRLQVDGFLRHHTDARLLPLPPAETVEGQLLPNFHHDGFFYALLHKA
ncbi:MAG TPA: 16S rRNA (cytosine(967)-C(5))-methyltransferase RsmB [Nitrosospira sp.]